MKTKKCYETHKNCNGNACDYETKPTHTPTPEEILKAIGAQIILGEWRFPFYGKSSVAQMLPLEEWINKRRQIGHSYEKLERDNKALLYALESLVNIDEELDSIPFDSQEIERASRITKAKNAIAQANQANGTDPSLSQAKEGKS